MNVLHRISQYLALKIKYIIKIFDILLREGFNKNQKKSMEFSTLSGGPPPPPKVWNKYFFLFHIWVLKSVLMRRNFFSFFSRVPTPDSRGTDKCRGT